MKIKPILFSTDMVLAILEGNKRQTRRIIKQQPEVPSSLKLVNCPYGTIGDVLWVKETFYTSENFDNQKPSLLSYLRIKIFYKADIKNLNISQPLHRGKFRPSIFMPYSSARLFLKITNVRVERLKDISRGDAMLEGCPFSNMAKGPNPKYWFYELWSKINGTKSLENNPFVWVIDFETTEKPKNIN